MAWADDERTRPRHVLDAGHVKEPDEIGPGHRAHEPAQGRVDHLDARRVAMRRRILSTTWSTVELVGVDDDGVGRRPQWGDRALGVDAVARLHLFAHRLLVHRLAAPFVLRGAPTHLLLEARGEEELVIGVRENDGADVATRHHHAALSEAPLLRDQRLTHARDRRDARQRIHVIGVKDALGELDAVGPNPFAVDLQLGRFSRAR